MSRRDNANLRCSRCRLHQSLCFCERLVRLTTRTQLLLVIHRFEDRKPTNTGRLATECLVNSRVLVRGEPGQRDPEVLVESGYQPLLLFPSTDARPLSDFAQCERPISLIVPDGNWRQASKMRLRMPGLSEVPVVALPKGQPERYRLRFEPHPDGLSTMEAIARAFGIIEGPEVEDALSRVLRIMVERTLWARGTINAHQVTDGLPDGAVRHDPTSGARSASECDPATTEDAGSRGE
jgi:DTW domain-containing protein